MPDSTLSQSPDWHFLFPPRSRYLQHDTALDEVIKGDLSPSLSVKFSDEDVVKLVREPVALKRNQSK